MDEYEIEGAGFIPARKHDRWTVLVLSLNYATQVVAQTASFASQLTEAAAQHREHLMEEKKFHEIVRGGG